MNETVSVRNRIEHIPHPKYRPDIDGLRAVAILSVIGYHGFPFWIRGGFIGVDIFFVISGYLISTILYESLRLDAFSFVEFYIRRIKRIFPALLFVLTSCIIFGWFALLADEYKQLAKHITGGVGFVSNYMFWKESSYFDNAADTKPLLHLWSLGIEEQFYILWPLILWSAWKQKFNILTIILSLTIFSFILNIKSVSTDAVAAFYSPQTRFWELLAGALLAYFTIFKQNILSGLKIKINSWLKIISHQNQKDKKIDLVSNIQSALGSLLIVIGLIRISKEFHYPGLFALLPTLGAILIISAGSHSWINRKILANRVFVWFGLISYPLYLWHWPLLSFARIFGNETPSRSVRISAILISVFLAWLTYRLIENPLRFGKYSSKKAVILTVLMLLLGLGAFDSFKNNRVSGGAAKVESLSRQIGWTIPVSSMEQIENCHTMFPERTQLSPKERDDNFCIIAKNKTPNVVFVGDSLNLSIFPGISKDDKMNALVLSASAAAPFYNIRTTEFNDSIRMFNYRLTNQALDYAIENADIKIVVLSFLNGTDLTDAKNAFKITNIENLNEKNPKHILTAALASTLKKLISKKKKVIYILPNPMLNYDIKNCLASYRPFKPVGNSKKDCSESYLEYMNQGGREYREWIYSVLNDFPQVKVIDLAKVLCEKDICWGMKDGKVLYRDRGHLSDDGSELVAPFIIEQIHQELDAVR